MPAKYLLWLYDNDRCAPAVKHYIEDNMDALKKEAEKECAVCGTCAHLREVIYGFPPPRLFCEIEQQYV
ncbi:hypothetical protein LJB87_02020, partial [Alistipes sp. OttesenSCG-928-L06]|nr:hypothetical protein [Alistipes sp. OttesenSCG-928-L06]